MTAIQTKETKAISSAETGRTNSSAREDTETLRFRLLKTTALLGCLALLPVSSNYAEAVELEKPQMAQSEKRWSFSIPAQDLASALMAFSETTGVQVLFKSQDLEGIQTTGLSGDANAEEGLRRLLGSTALSYRFSSDSSVVISALSGNPASADEPITLNGITIEGLRNITSYLPTEGYVSYYSVAATKTDTPVLETPQAISTIGREELDAHDAKTVAEAVRYSPGVSVDAYGVDPRGFDSINIRGFSSTTTGSFRDGLRMDGNFFAAYTTEPYGIERVDLMRGPSGALYGQAEAGGVIDRTTKRPRADMRQEVQIEAGSWNRLQGAFDVGGAATDDESLLFRVTGLARQSETEFDYNDGTEQDTQRFFIAPSVTWNPSEDTSLTILTDYLNDKRSPQFNTFGSDRIGRTNVVAGEPGFDKFDQEQYALGYVFTQKLGDDWEFRQNVRYTHVDVDYQTVVSNFLDTDGQTLQRYVWASPDEMNQIGIDNQLQTHVAWGPTHHTLLTGFDYSRSQDKFSYHYGTVAPLDINNVVYTGASLPAPYQATEQTLQQVGVYLQDQIELYDNWIITLGGRHSWIEQETDDLLNDTSESKNDSAFSGRAGLSYVFDNGIAPYVSYAEGFVPTQGANLSGESFEPTESVQYEAGIKYQPPSINALLTASVFHLTKTNVLTRDPDDINVTLQSGEIRSRGIELEAKASLFDGWDASIAYSYVDAEVTKSINTDLGKVPVIVPAHTASAWLHYNFSQGFFKGLGLGAGVRYVGHSYHDLENTRENDDYALVDATMSYDFNEDLTLKVNANNLFDKEYTTTCSFGSCYYGTGMRVTSSLTYHW